jgi:predicted DNA binding protein
MYEATIHVGDSDQPVPTAGRDVRVDLWCNDHCDLVRAVGSDADVVLEEIAEGVGIADRIEQGDERVAITEGCLAAERTDNVERYVAEHGCLLLPPLQYVDDDRVCRVLALDSTALRDVYRDLIADDHDVTVVSKRGVTTVTGDRPLLDPGGLVPDLTGRQREVVLTAIENGYYEIPRGISTEAIAEKVGVGRRTAENHLRRAEQKLVTALRSYL